MYTAADQFAEMQDTHCGNC